MASWITLLEISLSGSTQYYSSVGVVSPNAFFEPLVLSWGNISRAVPVRPGLPTTSNLTVQLSNATLVFSQLLETHTWRGVTARIRIGLEGGPLDGVGGFGTHYTGTIYSVSIENSICTIQIRDASYDKWSQPIPGQILASKFPNLPYDTETGELALKTTQANLVFGNVSSTTKVTGTHTGAANSVLFLQDSAKNFINSGVTVDDLIQNLTDGSKGTITKIGSTTNANDSVWVTLAGGTDNDWDVGDAYLVATEGQGRIKCPLIDVVNHRYLVACHRMQGGPFSSHYQTNGAPNIGDTSINIESDGSATGHFHTGDIITFAGDTTFYAVGTITGGDTPTSIRIDPGLGVAVGNHALITQYDTGIDEVYIPATLPNAFNGDGTQMTPDQVPDPIVEYDDDGWTYLKFTVDVENPDLEYSVTCDGRGLESSAPIVRPGSKVRSGDGTGTLLTNPTAATMQYLILAGANTSSDYDTTSYDALILTQNANGRVVSGIIDQEGWTHKQVIEQFMVGFSFQIFYNAAGKLKFADYRVETVAASDPAPANINDQDHVLKDTLAIFQNQDVINSTTLHYGWNSVDGRFLQEPQPLENLTSKTNLGSTFSEDLPLYLVSDSATATAAASNRMYYSDEDRYQVRFQIGAPQAPGTLDLCTNLLLTHFAGLSSERQTSPPKTTETTGDPPVTKTYGWVDELMRVTQLDYQLNGTPIITVVCLTMDPGENAYDFGVVPANVICGTITESAVGLITVPWTLSGGATDPTWVNVYYKRATDKLSAKRFSGRVLASALTHSFTPEYDTSAALDIFLVPEDVHGVIRELKWMIDTTKDTTLAAAVTTLTSPTFTIAANADPAIGAYALVDNEVVRVIGNSGATLTLYSEAGARICYEDTVPATHANATAIGTIKPTVAYGTLSNRTALSTPQNLTALIGLTWVTLGWDLYTDSNDLAMLRKYLIYRNTVNDFSSATCLNPNDTLTDNQYVDTSLTEVAEGADWPYYFYWVVGVNKSGVHSTNSAVNSAYGVSPMFSMVPPVTGLAFTEEGTVMVDGTSKSRVGVVFVQPDATADPGRMWKACRILKSPQLTADNFYAGAANTNAGAPNPNWNQVAELDGSGHIYLDPDETKVLLAGVSVDVTGEAGLTDQYYTDAAKIAGQQSDVALANAGKLAQGFIVKTSRTVGRFEVFLTLLGTLTSAATVTLSVCANSAGAPGSALTNGTSTPITPLPITTAGGFVEFNFPVGVALTANTQYWLVLEPSGTYAAEADGSNQIQWGVDATDPRYAFGNWSVYAGSAWTADITKDGLFRACSYYYPRASLELTGKLAVEVPVVQNFDVGIRPRTTTTSEAAPGGPESGVFFATWNLPTGITTNEVSHYVLNYSEDIGFDAAVEFNSNPTRVAGNVTHTQAYMPGRSLYWAIKAVLKNGDESAWIYLMDDAPINTQASPHVRTLITAYKLAIKRADQADDVGVILDVNNAVVGIDLRGITINTIGQTEAGARMMLNQNGLLAFNSTSTSNSTGKTVLVDATNGSFEFGDLSNPSGNKITYDALTGILTISGTQTGGSSSTDITGGTIGGIAISGSRIYSTNFSAGSAGFQIKNDGTAEFQAVTIRTAGAPSDTSSLIYAGSKTGDYATAWYGVFMNSKAISGRRNATVNGYHPNVFVLAADTYAGDAVLPALTAGDFILADDCKVAVETPTSSAYFLKLISGVLGIKAKVNILGASSFDGAVTLSSSSSISCGQSAYDTGNPGFWLGNTAASVTQFSLGDPAGSKITYSTATGTLTVTGSLNVTNGGTVGGWNVGTSTITGTNVTLDSAGTIKAGTSTNTVGMTQGSGLWAGAAAYAITDPFAVSVAGKLYANDVVIRAAGNFGVASGTIYAGDISGASAVNDWYGTFMSDKGITGRRVVSGVDTKNPLVFLLGSNDFTNLGDTVWPTFRAGDFIVADDVYTAKNTPASSAAYLRFLFDGAGAASLSWKGANTSLTEAGLFTATNAVITGAITASSGSFTGNVTTTTGGLITGAENGARCVVNATGIAGYSGAATIAFLLATTAGTYHVGDTDYVMAVGDLVASQAKFTGATVSGAITATSLTANVTGSIAGWSFNSTSLYNASSNIVLTSGTVDQANITVGTGATAGGISAADASGEIIFWGGSAWADRAATATPFKVTAGGAMTATGATIQSAASGNSRYVINPTNIIGYNAAGAITFAVSNTTQANFDGSGYTINAGDLWALNGYMGGWAIATAGLSSAAGGNTTGMASGGTNAFYAGTTGSPQFKVTHAGVLTATGVNVTGAITASSGSFTGTITANDGYIGTAASGWTIAAGKLYGGSGSAFSGMIRGTGTTKAFFAGATDNAGTGSTFSVTSAGVLSATAGVFKTAASGGRIEFDSAKIVGYDEDGTTVNFALAASAQTIDGYTINPGDIWARTGYIGGWVIASTGLSSASGGNTTGMSSGGTNAFYSGTTGSPQFKVTHAGAITATSGTLGGFTLSSTRLYSSTLTLISSETSVGLIQAGDAVNYPEHCGGIYATADGSKPIFWAGSNYAGASTAPFQVGSGGGVIATIGLLTTGLIISPTTTVLYAGRLVDLDSTTATLVIPRMTTTERTTLTSNACNGMMLYNSTLNKFEFYQGGAWATIAGGAGDVTGPGSSTDHAIARFHSTTGKIIQDSTVIVDDAGQISGLTTFNLTSVSNDFNIKYNTSNRFNMYVGSTGIVTLDAIGTAASFSFSDSIAITSGSFRVGSDPTGWGNMSMYNNNLSGAVKLLAVSDVANFYTTASQLGVYQPTATMTVNVAHAAIAGEIISLAYGKDGYGIDNVGIWGRASLGNFVVATITGTANAGGAVKLTTSGAHGIPAGARIRVTGVTGTTEANGIWIVTVPDSTHLTLTGSTYASAWISGGTLITLGRGYGLVGDAAHTTPGASDGLLIGVEGGIRNYGSVETTCNSTNGKYGFWAASHTSEGYNRSTAGYAMCEDPASFCYGAYLRHFTEGGIVLDEPDGGCIGIDFRDPGDANWTVAIKLPQVATIQGYDHSLVARDVLKISGEDGTIRFGWQSTPATHSANTDDMIFSTRGTERMRINYQGDMTYQTYNDFKNNVDVEGSNGLYIVNGIKVGAATGGFKGAGTINVSAGVYLNNTGFNNPDYVLEHYFTGKIEKFIANAGASDYDGLKPLGEVRDFMKQNHHLPRIKRGPSDIFDRGDMMLATMEEAMLYIGELEDRIVRLESNVKTE